MRRLTAGLVSAALLLTGCSGDPSRNGPPVRTISGQTATGTGAATATPTPRPVIQPRAVPANAKLPVLDHWAVVPAAPRDPAPAKPTAGMTAHLTKDAVVFARPGGAPIGRFPATTYDDASRVPVLDRTSYVDWILVPLPVRRGLPSKIGSPNHAVGWIHVPSSGVRFEPNPYTVRVETAKYRMTILKNGKPQRAWTIAIGTEWNPTPKGVRTYISTVFSDPAQSFSRQIAALSVFSDVLDSFSGGPAPSAIHGWFGETATQPIKVTNGCVRVPDDALTAVISLPIGTPVFII